VHAPIIEPAAAVLQHEFPEDRRGRAYAHHVYRSSHRSKSPHHYSHSTHARGFSEHRSHSRSHERSHSHTRTRSRSHSRNRYPQGLAPPLQAVGGGPDVELHTKFLAPFESAGSSGSRYPHGHYPHTGTSPPMSPRMMEARNAFEQARRDREDAELRLLMADKQRRVEHEHMLRTQMYGETSAAGAGYYDPSHPDSPRFFAPRGYDRSYVPAGDDEESRFELDGEEVRPEPKLSPSGAAGSTGNVLVCALCESRFEEPPSGTAVSNPGAGGKVPRYLLCGHTFCTGCLSKLVDAQQELRLANDTGSNVAKPGTISLACPQGASCGPTPVSLENGGALSLPINRSYLDVSKFLRSRRAAGIGLKDTGIGRGDDRGEEEKVAELNAELTADAQAQSSLALNYGLSTSLPCQQCQVHVAALYCQACNVRFCASCSASVHVGRALADHVKRGLVLPINVARARGLLFQGPGNVAPSGSVSGGLMCSTHADQSLSLFCRTCQLPVCRDCVTPLFHGKHLPPAHDVDLLSTVLASTAQELKGGVQALEGVVSRIEHSIAKAGQQVGQVNAHIDDVRAELKDSFALVRAACLRALAEREKQLEADLVAKARQKEERIQQHRALLAKTLVSAKAAQEEGLRVLGASAASNGESPDIFSIKALLDVRAAILSGSGSSAAALPIVAGEHDVLLRVKPRDLIRTLEGAIAKQGGVIAAIPSSPTFVSFAAAGASVVLTWAPASLPVEGEVLEYTLDVCELPRAWRTQLRTINPSLFPDPPAPTEDSEEEEKWNGQGALLPTARAAVNWLSVGPGAVSIGGAELMWKLASGADWAGPFTTLYSGEAVSVKHDNLNVLSAYIYRLTVKNDLGASQPTYSLPITMRQWNTRGVQLRHMRGHQVM
jgi:hypothetical protein